MSPNHFLQISVSPNYCTKSLSVRGSITTGKIPPNRVDNPVLKRTTVNGVGNCVLTWSWPDLQPQPNYFVVSNLLRLYNV